MKYPSISPVVNRYFAPVNGSLSRLPVSEGLLQIANHIPFRAFDPDFQVH